MNASRGHRCKQAENQEKWHRLTGETRTSLNSIPHVLVQRYLGPIRQCKRSKNISPLSRSHSGEDAPLHSLRGPRMGDIRLKSDKETVLGRSRLQGREEGEVEVGEAEEKEEEEDEKG